MATSTSKLAPTKTVDAESVEKIKPQVDTSGLAKAIQAAVNSTAGEQDMVNPAAFIAGASPRLTQLYTLFSDLRDLGRQLKNMAPQDRVSVLPGFEKFELHYRRADADEKTVVQLSNTMYVGNLRALVADELAVLLFTIRKDVEALVDITQRTKEQLDKACDAWTENNKDRQIQEAGSESAESDAAPTVTPE